MKFVTLLRSLLHFSRQWPYQRDYEQWFLSVHLERCWDRKRFYRHATRGRCGEIFWCERRL